MEKTRRWESELWSYLSSGDGTHCPIYSHCENRKKGGWSPGDNVGSITQLLDDGLFDARKYDSISNGRCGKTFQLVAKLAEQFLKRSRVQRLPVPDDIVSLADKQCPVEIRLIPLKVYHGAIWRIKDGWIIQLKSDDEYGRRRFSLFHEAFHILAHCNGSPLFSKKRRTRGAFNELLADYFSGCVLMPREWVMKKWAEIKDLDRMVEIFNVTKPLMWLRLRELGLV